MEGMREMSFWDIILTAYLVLVFVFTIVVTVAAWHDCIVTDRYRELRKRKDNE